MIFSDQDKANANVKIEVIDVNTKEILQVIEKHNLVVTLGRSLICDLLAMTVGVTGLNYFAVGLSTTAVTLADIKLGTEEFRDSFTKVTVSGNNVKYQYYLASSDANGHTLTEAGLFGDNATGTADTGTLFARVTHDGISKAINVAINYSWDITFN
jgi:hypothetical protein